MRLYSSELSPAPITEKKQHVTRNVTHCCDLRNNLTSHFPDLYKLNYLVSSFRSSNKATFLSHRAKGYLFQQQIILKEGDITILLITFK